MIPARSARLLLLGSITFCLFLPLAYAESYSYYAVGTFQFDASSISGNTGGICSGDCAPWGDLAVLNVSFSSSVIGYKQSTSCSNDQCETKISGELGAGALSAAISVGYPSQMYYLSSSLLTGSFESRFCDGDNCRSNRPETELFLNFSGTWNNNWDSAGTVELHCFENNGCSDGSGAGELDTFVPEGSTLMLLASGIGSLGCAIRRNTNV